MSQDELFMKRAIELSELAIKHGNEPFGAVLVKDGVIVYTNENQIYSLGYRSTLTFKYKCYSCSRNGGN